MADEHYNGVVHVHSTRSFDGQCSYAKLRSSFLEEGLRFACITEHVEGLDQAAIQRVIDECRSHSDGEFVFVPGFEMECYSVFFVGTEKGPIDFSSDRTVFDSLRALSRLCILAHPVQVKCCYSDWVIDACDGVEIWNARHEGYHYVRPQSEALLTRIRTNRPKAIGLAGLDLHAPGDYRALTLRLNGCEPLTEQFVVSQLAAGRFDILKDGCDIASIGAGTRAALRARIRAMDAAHAVHRCVARMGIGVPVWMKRVARAATEG